MTSCVRPCPHHPRRHLRRSRWEGVGVGVGGYVGGRWGQQVCGRGGERHTLLWSSAVRESFLAMLFPTRCSCCICASFRAGPFVDFSTPAPTPTPIPFPPTFAPPHRPSSSPQLPISPPISPSPRTSAPTSGRARRQRAARGARRRRGSARSAATCAQCTRCRAWTWGERRECRCMGGGYMGGGGHAGCTWGMHWGVYGSHWELHGEAHGEAEPGFEKKGG